MRRTLLSGVVATLAVATPAMAQATPDKPVKPAQTPYQCIPKTIGYSAKGTFVSGNLTQSSGADTATKHDDRYSGTLTVFVKRANHKSVKDEQTFAVDNARVAVHPDSATPTAGDRVKLHGKTTKANKKCDPVAPTVTVRRIDIKTAKSA